MKVSIPIAVAIVLSIVPISSAFSARRAEPINTCNTIIQSPGNYALVGDLNCVDVHGIRIQSTRVKLSLNGYTISGNGYANTNGIWVQSGSRITISGPGRITGFNGSGFSHGIYISPSPTSSEIKKCSVSGLVVDNNRFGISVAGANTVGVAIKDNVVKDNELFGIDIAGGAYDGTVGQNEVLNNGDHGIYVAGSAGFGNSITSNNASYNGTGASGANILVGAGAVDGTVVESNIALYGAASDIVEQDGSSTYTNNTCFTGVSVDCPNFGILAIDH